MLDVVNLLALDLGTKTGWAMRTSAGIVSGVRNTTPRSKEGPAARWYKFRALLTETHAKHELGAIYFEDVKAHGKGQVLAAHVYGGFVAHLQHWAERNDVPLHPVGVGTVKKHWTGKGNASKDEMLREACARGYEPADDNEADALALLDYARCAEGEPTPTALELPPVPLVLETWVDPFKAAA